jgi:hypothetical protein
MALHALSLPRPREAFEPLRSSMSNFLKVSTASRKYAGKALKKIPKVVYVDRQDTSRRLRDDDHEELVEYLRKMEKKGKVEFVHGKFGSLGLRDQVKSVLDADVRAQLFLLVPSNPFVPIPFFLRNVTMDRRSLRLRRPRWGMTLISDNPRSSRERSDSSTVHVIRRCRCGGK